MLIMDHDSMDPSMDPTILGWANVLPWAFGSKMAYNCSAIFIE